MISAHIVALRIKDPLFSSTFFLVGVAVGSVLPDADLVLGKRFHRTFTHSITVFAIAVALLWKQILENPFLAGLAFGWGCHILQDMFSKTGVPFFLARRVKIPVYSTGKGLQEILGSVLSLVLLVAIFEGARWAAHLLVGFPRINVGG